VTSDGVYRLSLLGTFRLVAPDGRRLTVSSRKAVALLALLATAESGERSRAWLQEMLWGKREVKHAQASLRREVFNLKKATEDVGMDLIRSDGRFLRLQLDNVHIDVRQERTSAPKGEFLEGIGLRGEPMFETWLHEIRAKLEIAAPHERHGEHNEAARDRALPAHGTSEANCGISLLVFPFAVTGDEDDLAIECRRVASRYFAEHLSRSRYFATSIWPLGLEQLTHPQLNEAFVQSGARFSASIYVISRQGEKRLTLTLIKAPDARLLWTEQFTVSDDPQSREFWFLIQRIVNRTIKIIFQDEVQAALQKNDEDLDYTGLIWLARYYLYQSDEESFCKARQYIDRAMVMHPRAPESRILDAMYKIIHHREFSDDVGHIGAFRRLAQQVINADKDDVRGPSSAAMVDLLDGDLEQAIENCRTVIKMVPGYTEAHIQLAEAHLLNGDLDVARESLETALRLTPTPWLEHLVWAYSSLYHVLIGDLQAALSDSHKALAVVPEQPLALLVRMHALLALGRERDAEELFAEFAWLRARLERLVRRMKFRDQQNQDTFRSTLDYLRDQAVEPMQSMVHNPRGMFRRRWPASVSG
jgi:tetratricopeptide (TPR) repeat protein